MKSGNFFKFISIGLALLNIGLVSFFLISKPKAPRAPLNGNGVIKAAELLKLDDQQQKEFGAYANRNRSTMDSLSNIQRNLLKEYFLSITKSNTSQPAKSYVDQLSAIEEYKLKITYDHFQEIKSLLRADQSTDFKQFINHIITTRFSNQKRMPPPPRNRY